ncbi:hypothetical protein RND71_009053 [Anisodus tanguticus]|uniref:Uncharacterized protein n=1 Tax=Anisodus tanguticus TaxID=243964 RepID=A0AAE1SPT5_9SOLA|nr:hypothetical protein RND71_009053 [Anisodus tanguticus]
MEFNKFIKVDQEEEEDSLSFRDLPIYSNAKEWENYNSSESQSSNSSQEEGLFEFFNQEWIKNQFSHHQDIIFCGKTIKKSDPQKLKNKKRIGDYITFFQGISRSFSQEMELRDLKRRQSNNKVSSPSSFHCRKINDEKKGKGKGLWWLIKKMSCSDHSYHAQAVVKASISYIPQVM